MKTRKRYQEMSADELAEATRRFDKPWTGKGLPGRAMTAKERAKFEAWQHRAAAKEKKPSPQPVTLLFPPKLIEQLGELARQKRTTPATLVKRIVQDAVEQAVSQE